MKYPGTDLKALITESGEVGVQPFENPVIFVNKMQAFIDTHREVFTELIACGKDINQKS